MSSGDHMEGLDFLSEGDPEHLSDTEKDQVLWIATECYRQGRITEEQFEGIKKQYRIAYFAPARLLPVRFARNVSRRWWYALIRNKAIQSGIWKLRRSIDRKKRG